MDFFSGMNQRSLNLKFAYFALEL